LYHVFITPPELARHLLLHFADRLLHGGIPYPLLVVRV
jgi:hypothetical protein